MVNIRDDLGFRPENGGLSRRSNGASATALVAYETALAAMEARVAAIADGQRRRAGLAAGAPPALHRRHQRQAGGSDRRALPGARGRPRRAVHLSRPRPAGRLSDARPQAPRAGRAPLRRDAGGMADPHARAASTCAASGARTASASGCARPEQGAGHEDKIAAIGIRLQALGQPARHRAQRRSGPVALFRHRAVRRRGHALRRDQPRRPRACR